MERSKRKYGPIEDVNEYVNRRVRDSANRKMMILIFLCLFLFLISASFFLMQSNCKQQKLMKRSEHHRRKAEMILQREEKEPCANVLFISSDNYYPCTVVAIYSLKYWAKTTVPIVLMASEDVSANLLDHLSTEFGVRIEYIDYIKNPNTLKRSKRLENNYSKWRVWELNFDKVIYFDSDFLMLKNEDDLCEILHPFSSTINYSSKDGIWPDSGFFNAGFFAANTSLNTLYQMVDQSKYFESPTGGDQPFLNEYWKGRWHKLNELRDGVNANAFDQNNYKWDPTAVRSFHMTSHLNPCIQAHSPEIFRDLAKQARAGTLDKNHPVSLWFKARDELLFNYPSFESYFKQAESSGYCAFF